MVCCKVLLKTGYVVGAAVLAAVACAPQGVPVHVYGMNFATEYYFLHDKTAEYEVCRLPNPNTNQIGSDSKASVPACMQRQAVQARQRMLLLDKQLGRD